MTIYIFTGRPGASKTFNRIGFSKSVNPLSVKSLSDFPRKKIYSSLVVK